MAYRLLMVLLASALVSACSNLVPQYELPQGSAFAYIKNDIGGTSGRNNSIVVWVDEGNESGACTPSNTRKLYSITDSGSKPTGKIKVAADKRFVLTYAETMPGRHCYISLEVVFEAGKEYSLLGGPAYSDSSIDPRMCQFGIKDIQSGKPVQSRRLCQK